MAIFPPVCSGDRQYCVAELHPSGGTWASRRPAGACAQSVGVEPPDRAYGLLSRDHANQELSIRDPRCRHSAVCGPRRSGEASGLAHLAEVRAKIIAFIGGKSNLASSRG